MSPANPSKIFDTRLKKVSLFAGVYLACYGLMWLIPPLNGILGAVYINVLIAAMYFGIAASLWVDPTEDEETNLGLTGFLIYCGLHHLHIGAEGLLTGEIHSQTMRHSAAFNLSQLAFGFWYAYRSRRKRQKLSVIPQDRRG